MTPLPRRPSQRRRASRPAGAPGGASWSEWKSAGAVVTTSAEPPHPPDERAAVSPPGERPHARSLSDRSARPSALPVRRQPDVLQPVEAVQQTLAHRAAAAAASTAAAAPPAPACPRHLGRQRLPHAAQVLASAGRSRRESWRTAPAPPPSAIVTSGRGRLGVELVLLGQPPGQRPRRLAGLPRHAVVAQRVVELRPRGHRRPTDSSADSDPAVTSVRRPRHLPAEACGPACSSSPAVIAAGMSRISRSTPAPMPILAISGMDSSGGTPAGGDERLAVELARVLPGPAGPAARPRRSRRLRGSGAVAGSRGARPRLGVGRHPGAALAQRARGGRLERQPAHALEVQLGPGVGVVGADRPLAADLRAARVADRHPRGDAERSCASTAIEAANCSQ